MSKKVSIVIPVYNGANYLKDAIDSALSQTYDNIEIIVVNDGSNDNGSTKRIAESYGNKIKYYEKENGGASSALNYGISKMTGDYFSWLSHDDMYYPTKIEKQMEEIKKYNNKTILFSNYDLIDASGKKFDTVCLDHTLLIQKPDYAVLRGCIGGITLLIPKEALEECGSFRLDLRCTQDYDMWFRMLNKYTFVHMEDVLAMTRIHSMQDTQTSPRTISEGNNLWVYMTENYPLEKKIQYEGSEFLFYKEMDNFLGNTPYKEARKKVKEIAKQCIEKQRKRNDDLSVEIIVIENDNPEDLKKTMNSIKGVPTVTTLSDERKLSEEIKKVKRDYITILHAGVEVKENWLEEMTLYASVTNKGVIIPDYGRPLRTGNVDNYCSFLIPIDGVFIKKEKDVLYENPYQFLLDTALKTGSIIVGESLLKNVKDSYGIEEVLNYLKRILEIGKSSNYQIATLNYEIACIYNHNASEGKKVQMYEPCDELKELYYSRSFQLYKKYYEYKKKRKKKL